MTRYFEFAEKELVTLDQAMLTDDPNIAYNYCIQAVEDNNDNNNAKYSDWDDAESIADTYLEGSQIWSDEHSYYELIEALQEWHTKKLTQEEYGGIYLSDDIDILLNYFIEFIQSNNECNDARVDDWDDANHLMDIVFDYVFLPLRINNVFSDLSEIEKNEDLKEQLRTKLEDWLKLHKREYQKIKAETFKKLLKDEGIYQVTFANRTDFSKSGVNKWFRVEEVPDWAWWALRGMVKKPETIAEIDKYIRW